MQTIANQIVSAINNAILANESLSQLVADLWSETVCPKETGRQIGKAADGHVLDKNPIRVLAEAVYNVKGIERKDASKLLNATGLVSKQRVAQILAVVFDGDSSKNCGKAAAKPAADKPAGDSFAAIMAILSGKNLTLSEEQADAILAAVASKVI
jgi:hypothetical protein